MKFAVVLLCIGAAMAQVPTTPAPANNNRPLVESLEKRAAALEARVHQVLQDNRAQNNFLLMALDRQSIMIEALALELKTAVADTTRMHTIHQIHVIEEDLLRLENRASEEIMNIETVRSGADRRNETPAQLAARAERLVKDAQDAVAKFPTAPEVREISSEIIVVEALLKTIQGPPAPAAADLMKDEDELARQERTLRQLIEKATQRRPTV